MRKFTSSVCLVVFVSLCAAGIGCGEQGQIEKAANLETRATPVLAENASTKTVPVKTTTVQEVDKQAPEKNEPSALDKARNLLRQADETGDGVKKWLGDRFEDTTDGGQDAAQSAKDAAQNAIDWANETFKTMKEQGLTTADSAQEWFMEDYKSMGSWEYKILKINPNAEVSETESTLNKLGAERWECFNVTRPTKEGSLSYYHFKRPRRSYLKNVPLKDLMRLVPLMGGGNADEQQ